jgi:hypothetical protein
MCECFRGNMQSIYSACKSYRESILFIGISFNTKTELFTLLIS